MVSDFLDSTFKRATKLPTWTPRRKIHSLLFQMWLSIETPMIP